MYGKYIICVLKKDAKYKIDNTKRNECVGKAKENRKLLKCLMNDKPFIKRNWT